MIPFTGGEDLIKKLLIFPATHLSFHVFLDPQCGGVPHLVGRSREVWSNKENA